MKSKIKRLPKSEIELILTIPAGEVKKTYEEVVAKVAKTTEMKGFRKGKAPKKMVEDSVDKGKAYEQVIGQLLPKYYSEAIKEHGVSPIVNPKVTPVTMEEGKDWQFKAVTCEAPEVDLDNYKSKLKAQTAKDKIWVPGKDKGDEKEKEIAQSQKLNQALETLTKTAKVVLPPILLDDEVKRRLAQTLDEVKKLGLTLEDYLRSAGKTIEQLREEQRKRAEETLQLEFIINKIADEENLTVTAEEIDKAVKGAKTEEERARLEANKYVLAMLLRRQKVLDFLKNL